MNYREDQKEIMAYNGGKVAVPAVPGAGKTFVLTHLSAKLLKTFPEKKILILTFMNSAVGNFKTRITKLLGDMGLDSENRFEVMTIHSLAMKIVQHAPQVVGLDEEFNVVDEVQRNYLIRLCVEEWRFKNREKFESFIEPRELGKEFRGERTEERWEKDLCQIFKSVAADIKHGISGKKIENIAEKLGKGAVAEVFIEIFYEYQKKLKRSALIDFDDILTMALVILKSDSGVREYFQKKYDFIFEDEAQDSNKVQGEILEILSELNGNIVKVGDVNQSILATFTASDPKLFKKYCNTVKCAKLFSAGRSSKEIIETANYFMDRVRNENPVTETREALELQHIKPVKQGEHPKNPVVDKYGVVFRKLKNWNEEIEFAVKYAKEFLKKFGEEHNNGTSLNLKNIAILVNDSYSMSDITQKLDEEKVEYEELNDMSKEKIKCVRKLGKILEFAGEQSDEKVFFDTLCLLTDIKRETLKKDISAEIAEKGVADILHHRGNPELSPFENLNYDGDEYDRIRSAVKLLKKVSDFPKNSYEELVLYLSEILRYEGSEKAIAQNVAASVNNLFLMNPKWSLADLGRELGDVRNNRFSYFSKLVYDANGYEPSREKVTVATYHKSKGMEWDCVIMTGLSSANFPAKLTDNFKGEYNYLRKEYSAMAAKVKAELDIVLNDETETFDSEYMARCETISERVRLLYVGITRAKEYLIGIGSEEKGKKKHETYYLDMLDSISIINKAKSKV